MSWRGLGFAILHRHCSGPTPSLSMQSTMVNSARAIQVIQSVWAERIDINPVEGEESPTDTWRDKAFYLTVLSDRPRGVASENVSLRTASTRIVPGLCYA